MEKLLGLVVVVVAVLGLLYVAWVELISPLLTGLAVLTTI